MAVENNLGVTYDALADLSGDASYRPRAMSLYMESARAWDALTRDQTSMVRMTPDNSFGPGINQGFLNSSYDLHPTPGYEPQIYPRLDKDVLEPSVWEQINPPAAGLSGDIPFQIREQVN
jgi:hypothetical protein